MSSRTFRTSWPLLAAAVGVAVLAAVAGAGRGVAGTDCLYGQITMSSRPLLSAPSPAQVGDTITSSGGGWAVCGGEGINGFNKEWLRDGTVISGPDWVAGWPDSFTYTIQAADVGHELRSAVSPCDDDFGCYTPPAQSSNAVVPVAPPPPPPPSPPIAVQGHVYDSTGAPVSGAAVVLYRDLETDGSAGDATPLDRTTTASDGSYVLRASPDGLTDADGWVNFAVEGTAGDVPYYAVATRQWNGSDWLSADQADTPATDPSYPVLPEDVDLDPQGGSIANGDGPDVQSPACWLAQNQTTLVATERDPTIIGELHVAQDATGTFTYGEGSRADSNMSVATNLGGGWHVNLGVFKHITRSDSSSVSESNPRSDWAHDLLSDFVYAKYRHERISDWDGRVCSTWYTIEPKEWWGGIRPGADESRYLHQCRTTYRRFANDFGPNSTFGRTNYRLRTWGAAATVAFGTGGLTLRARSGASQRVRFSYVFGTNRDHYLCGNDNRPAQSTRILAGG